LKVPLGLLGIVPARVTPMRVAIAAGVKSLSVNAQTLIATAKAQRIV
jgi:hypothetical protein